MNRFSQWIPLGMGAVILGVVLASVGCGTTKSSSSKGTQMRVVHLSPDEGPLDLLIDNTSVSSNITYGAPTAFVGIAPGNHDLKLNLPGSSINVLDKPKDNFVAGTSYTNLIIGFAAGLGTNQLIDDHVKPSKGMFKIRVVNGSPTLGSVDIYLVTKVNGVDKITTVAGVASNSASPYQMLDVGTYQIYITQGGAGSTCLTVSPPCLIHLDGTGGMVSPTFADGQVRTLIMKNQIPVGTGLYDTITLTDLN